MDETIRYGIIGTGMMGWEHILNLALTPGAQVTAIADPNEPSLQVAQSLAGEGVAVHRDYREMLRHEALDAVVIATPNYTHHDVLQDVFRTRLHVLVEKPMCTTAEDCHRIVDAAARHPGLVWVGMEYRYMPAVSALLESLRAGEAGRLRMIAIREHRFPFLPKVGDWNRFSRNTGGTLVEKCCHFFDLMNLIAAARPRRVFASGAQDVNHLEERYDGETPDILDNAFALVDYDNGIRAMLDLCMFADHSPHEVEVTATGDQGKVQAFEPDHEWVRSRRDGSPPERRKFELEERLAMAGAHHGSTFHEHVAFQQAIRSGGKPAVTVEDGALAVAVGLAAERSAATGEPVDLADLGF